MRRFYRGRAGRFPGRVGGGLAIVALAAVALAAPASASASDKNCCFAVSVAVNGGFSVQYGSNPQHPKTGSYGVGWAWATRELVSYENGGLRDLGSKVTVGYGESWNVSQHRFGTDATQDPEPCKGGPSFFVTPGRYLDLPFFVDTAASRLSLGEMPSGKPAINLGLGGHYAQLGPNCPQYDSEHASGLGPWSYTIPGPPTKFLQIANQGDTFRPPEFNGGTLTYSHPYMDASVVSPHAFTGQSTVSVGMAYFPKSNLDEREKRLKQCKEIEKGTCGPRGYGTDPVTSQDLSGIPDANAVPTSEPRARG